MLSTKVKIIIVFIVAIAVCFGGYALYLKANPSTNPSDSETTITDNSDDSSDDPSASGSTDNNDNQTNNDNQSTDSNNSSEDSSDEANKKLSQLNNASWYKTLSSDKKEFVTYVINNKWNNEGRSATISFKDDGACEYVKDSTTNDNSWSMKDISTGASDHSQGSAILCLGENSSVGEYVITITKTPTDTLNRLSYATDSYMTCSLFNHEPMWRITDGSEFSFKNVDSSSGFNKIISNDKLSQFEKDFRSYASDNLPTATMANWSSFYTVYPGQNQISTYLICNDSKSTKVYVTIDSATGNYSFSSSDTSKNALSSSSSSSKTN
jgi:hypothetical protein